MRVEITDRKVVEIEHAKRDDVILAPGQVDSRKSGKTSPIS